MCILFLRLVAVVLVVFLYLSSQSLATMTIDNINSLYENESDSNPHFGESLHALLRCLFPKIAGDIGSRYTSRRLLISVVAIIHSVYQRRYLDFHSVPAFWLYIGPNGVLEER